MYVLYAPDHNTLDRNTQLFDRHMEPLLRTLEAAASRGEVPAALPEIEKYLQVCRWPFRRLEYTFALDVLLERLRPGDSYLDAGSGVTPLAHVVAQHGVRAHACDYDERTIEELRRFKPGQLYGSEVEYSQQDLTRLRFADASFDAISCISVLEHIPAPADQLAIAELLRVLKPGGVLVLTVDFTPPPLSGNARTGYLVNRALQLAARGNLRAIGDGFGRRINARRALAGSTTRHARSANQCFGVEHLEHDIAPALDGEILPSGLGFGADLRTYSAVDARRFWDLEPGLWNNQGQRDVLPAAVTVRKAIAGTQPLTASLPAISSL